MSRGVPSGTTLTDRFARGLAIAMGPHFGNAPDGTRNAEDLRVFGAQLAAVYTRHGDSVAEVHPRSSEQLLSELEVQYGLRPDGTLSTTERQSRLAAKVRATNKGSPNEIVTAVAPLDATASVAENTAASVAATNPLAVYMFSLLVASATWSDAALSARVRAIVEQMKPAYTQLVIGVRIGFRCDDPESLCDRDLLEI